MQRSIATQLMVLSIGVYAGLTGCSSAPDTPGSTGPTNSAAPTASTVQSVTASPVARELLPANVQRPPRTAAQLALASGTSDCGSNLDYPNTFVGVTGNTTVCYDPSLGSQGLSLAQQFLTAAGGAYDDLQTDFGIGGGATTVIIAPLSTNSDGSGGGYHYGCDFVSGGVLYLDATFGNTQVDPGNLELALYVAELSESFMGAQGTGWACGGSNGEGLSRYLAEHETAPHTLDPSPYVTAPSWANAGFPDWISTTEGTDRDYPSTGASVTYIDWMRSQGFSVPQIVQAAGSTLAANYTTLTGKTTAYSDLVAAINGIPVRNDNPFSTPNLLWQNPSSGEMSMWLLNGTTVTGTQSLNWQCGTGNNCSQVWNVVDTVADNTILWDNPTSGELQDWSFDDNGIVSTPPALSWQCSADSGCSSVWRPIGRITYKAPSCTFCFASSGLVWFNSSTGEVSIWQLLGSTVIGTESTSWSCGGSCPSQWTPMLTADFNNDGNSDILWYNTGSGQLSVWLLDGSANVTGTQTLSWTCSDGSGCASSWRLVQAADVNRDGNVDLLWHNANTGELSNWLLDGAGNVLGASSLSWQCDAPSGCSSAWFAKGYVQFP